jgi:hypothetical protein
LGLFCLVRIDSFRTAQDYVRIKQSAEKILSREFRPGIASAFLVPTSGHFHRK